MHKQRVSFWLILFFLLSTQSVFAQDAYHHCQDRLKERALFLNIEGQQSSKDLRSCIKDLFDLYNPAIFLKRKEVKFPDDSCKDWSMSCVASSLWGGAKGAVRLGGLNYYAGAKTYSHYIQAEFKEPELHRLDQYVLKGGLNRELTPRQREALEVDTQWTQDPENPYDLSGMKGYESEGLKIIVQQAYDDFEANQQGVLNHYNALKSILVEVSFHLIQSELLALGFEKSNKFDYDRMLLMGAHYSQSLKQCFDATESFSDIIYCMDQLRTYAVFGVAQDVLEKTLERHFLDLVPENKKHSFVKVVEDEFYFCSSIFFFNTFENRLPSKKMRACAFSSIVKAFESIVDLKVQENMRGSIDQKELVELRESSLAACQMPQIFNQGSHSLNYYDYLVQETPTSFEKKILACQPLAEAQIVKKIVYLTISKDPAIAGFYGESVNDFAKTLFESHYPTCMNQIKASGQKVSPEFCRNYLFASTVFTFIDDFMAKKVEEELKRLFTSDYKVEYKDEILAKAMEATKSCRTDIKKSSIERAELNQEQIEEEIVSCVSVGIVKTGEETARILIPIEIENHPSLTDFNVDLDPSVQEQIQKDFGACLKGELKIYHSLTQLKNAVNPALEKCQVNSYRSVMFFILDDIIKDKLTEVGMSELEAAKVIADYRKKKESLYSEVSRAENKNQLVAATENAYVKVVNDVAVNIIGFMIDKESGGLLSSKESSRVTSTVTKHFLACFDNKSLEVCRQRVYPFAVFSILINVLPRMAAAEFRNKSKSIFTKKQFNNLRVRQVISAGLGNKVKSSKLSPYIIKQLKKGRSIKKIQRDKTFLKYFYGILTSDNIRIKGKTLVQRMMKTLIQPGLSGERKNLGLLKIFVNKEIFVWENIEAAPEGAILKKEFKKILYRTVVEGRGISQKSVANFEALVKKVAKQINRRINREKNRSN